MTLEARGHGARELFRKLYASDKSIADASEQALSAEPATAIDRLLDTAWYLRQRDTKRALELVQRAERMGRASPEAIFTPSLHGRVCLIRAEAAWLHSRFETADTELEAARAYFAAVGDDCGSGDASLLAYHLAFDRKSPAFRQSCLRKSCDSYLAGHDSERTQISRAWQALDESFGGLSDALDRAIEAVGPADLDASPAVLGLLNFSRAQQSFLYGNYAAARSQFEQAARELRESGLVRQAIVAIVNASAATGNLNNFETQADMVKEALALARSTGWPQSLASCLYCLGDAHHSLGRYGSARTAFLEARELLGPIRSSRTYVVVTTFLGETNLRLGLDTEALEAFDDAGVAAEQGGHDLLLPRLFVGRANCLSRLNEADAALATARRALEASEGRDMVSQRLASLSLARIHGAHELPPPEDMIASSASLHYLEKLWTAQAADPHWTPDDEILGEFAAAWERVGDLRNVVYYERRRIEALARESTRRAEQQLAATQARQEALAARLESEHQRNVLESEKQRQIVLEQLSKIGQEICGSLDAVAILSAVDRHVGAMLEATSLSLWLLEDGMLAPVYARESGRPISGRRIASDDDVSVAARTMREQQEILIEARRGEISPSQIPGTLTLPTALFAPLSVGTRKLGVISIQSAEPHAYGDQERLIFRNICAYTAIALANASNYELLSASHAKLIIAQKELERLANYDVLTGLCNRRHLLGAGEAEIARASRSGAPLCVVLVDVDHFKSVNDTYGHLTGDVVLQSIAKLLAEKLRPSDTFARYGGEELVALLPETDEIAAVAIAERLRQAIASYPFEAAEKRFGVTVSIGVARWNPSESSIESALARADWALYQVKNGGRNGVLLNDR